MQIGQSLKIDTVHPKSPVRAPRNAGLGCACSKDLRMRSQGHGFPQLCEYATHSRWCRERMEKEKRMVSQVNNSEHLLQLQGPPAKRQRKTSLLDSPPGPGTRTQLSGEGQGLKWV